MHARAVCASLITGPVGIIHRDCCFSKEIVQFGMAGEMRI